MSDFDRQRMFAALILLVVALFVASGFPAARCRRELRVAAIVAFGAAAFWALIQTGL